MTRYFIYKSNALFSGLNNINSGKKFTLKIASMTSEDMPELSIGDYVIPYYSNPADSINSILRVLKVEPDCEFIKCVDYEKPINISYDIRNLLLNKLFVEINVQDFKLIYKQLKEKNELFGDEPEESSLQTSEVKDGVGTFNLKIQGKNKIYYGIPGCGKSYHIEHTDLEDVDKDHDVFRTTFYLDYSNSDFIGQIYPQVEKDNDGNDRVTYKRVPGPFTNALTRAYEAPNKMIYLVIEEINRGNAAAIFGDLFQLLDRLDKEWNGRYPGDSEYPINNEFIEGYLKEKNIKIPYGQNKIFIPKNLTILATMNTSDQNVFPLDTAFKRRWDRERVVVDWADVDNKFKSMYIPFTDHTWEEFASKVNEKMVSQGDDGMVLEDKQLGPYFINKDMLVVETQRLESTQENKDRLRKFVNNVIDYLYTDVTKFDHTLLFENNPTNYDDIYDAIIKYKNGEFIGDTNLGLNVFEAKEDIKVETEEEDSEED